ncbi:MAG: 23S rRNA (uracil(1939)-C(5))-methyltransferase RlmD [Oscillospiraceae bacterium]|nr:23S rRNA (uracil(1939)-C(5))-methyltransferase RlmD [Oscillospiraceae bacterium]
MPLEKNQVIQLKITGMTAEGNGVGRYVSDGDERGIAVFVPLTSVGDLIECHIVKVNPTHAYGRVEKILEPSSNRIEGEDCSVFGRCGGCVWRHIGYEAELNYKRQRVADALKRIGGLDILPQPIVGADNPDAYRNKAQYPVIPGEHRLMIGFYAPRSHRVIEQHHCLLQPPLFGEIVDLISKWAKKAGISAYDESTGKGLLRHIYIRRAEVTGEVMVGLVCTSGKVPHTDALVDLLKEKADGLASVMININREKTNVILGGNEFVLWGKDYITDELCGLRFRLSMRSFYQVNRRQAEKLYTIAAEAAGLSGSETILDLYCGTGTIGLTMAKKAGQIIGVEISAPAVEDARRNAAENEIYNARFICSDSAGAAERLKSEGIHPDIVVLDPPRKGCDAELIKTITEMSPERVIYISCDPATLARDLKRFDEMEYKTKSVIPVDMFPRTAHVETVVLMSRTKD